MHLLDVVAREAGVTPEQAGVVVTGALRRLHRLSVVDERRLAAVILEVWFEVGREACWHLAGLLEDQRVNHDKDLPWSEVLDRLDPKMLAFSVLVGKWRAASSGDGGTEA